MSEFFTRQMDMFRRLVCDYRNGVLDINTLVQRIEGLSNVLNIEKWNEGIFPVVLLIEQINAVALDAKRKLTAAEMVLIENSLCELEALIKVFEAEKINLKHDDNF